MGRLQNTVITSAGPVHLCGLSLGGILALNYALDFPEKRKNAGPDRDAS